MRRLGHPSPPVASEFLALGRELLPHWYRDLVNLTRAQVISPYPPSLDLAPRPFIENRDPGRANLLQQLGFTGQVEV